MHNQGQNDDRLFTVVGFLVQGHSLTAPAKWPDVDFEPKQETWAAPKIEKLSKNVDWACADHRQPISSRSGTCRHQIEEKNEIDSCKAHS